MAYLCVPASKLTKKEKWGCPFPLQGRLEKGLDTSKVTSLELPGMSQRYVSSRHLLFVREDAAIYAAPFDLDTLTVSGKPVLVIEDVEVAGIGAATSATSEAGTLVDLPGEPRSSARQSRVWVDRTGREETIAAEPRATCPQMGFLPIADMVE